MHFEEVLSFWFPSKALADPRNMPAQLDWWFRAGADAEVARRFAPLLQQAIAGEIDAWASSTLSRLALVIVLDQFSRSLFRGTPSAFAQDAKALALAREGIAIGHYDELGSPWKKIFALLPLSHSEDLAEHDLAVKLTERIAAEAPRALRELLEFAASQARGHRDVVARFGRHPHRNAVLGRQSTADEIEYLARGQFVQTRRFRGS